MKRNGFTLVELLVVISIIGLLSSVVLSSVKNASVRAANTQTNELANEYLNAFRLAYADNGGKYPSPSTTIIAFCVGHYADGMCGHNNDTTENDLPGPASTINNALKTYIPSLPVMKPVVVGPDTYEGPWAQCMTWVGPWASGYCSRMVIAWELVGSSQTCPAGASSFDLGGATECILLLD